MPEVFDKFLVDKEIDSSIVHMVKIGHIPRVDSIKNSEKLGKYFSAECKKRGIKRSYDITYGGKPKDLRYTEFFASTGGIQISACDGKMVRRMFNRSYDESNNVDFADMLDLSNHTNNDKYKLHSYDIEQMAGLVIMPGSNCLEEVIDKEKLNAAVLLGAKVCMHPLTNKVHKSFLMDQYGEENIIPTMYSGYKAMLHANCIYTTGTSELGLYAMLLGKHVVSISSGALKGGYLDAFNRVIDAPNQKDELNQLLNNPASGIIIPHKQDTLSAIDTWLDIYEEMLLDHDTVEIPELKRYITV